MKVETLSSFFYLKKREYLDFSKVEDESQIWVYFCKYLFLSVYFLKILIFIMFFLANNVIWHTIIFFWDYFSNALCKSLYIITLEIVLYHL